MTNKPLPEIKKRLVYKYGSVWQAAQDLNISYDRLTNILSSRTRISSDEIEKLAICLNLKKGWYQSTSPVESR